MARLVPLVRLAAALACSGLVAACASGDPPRPGALRFSGRDDGPPPSSVRVEPPDFADIGYATWQDDEPEYRLYPGDVLDVAALSAPELNRTVTVQPDGRISLPLLPPVMAADRSVGELKAMLAAGYSSQLLRPEVDVSVKQATPLKVFVGGEVDRPGVYDMPGDIDALQAIIMAGGFKTSARRSEILVIRRGPSGQAMMRTADMQKAIFDPQRSSAIPLRRFDVIYVPRSGIANLGLFVQQYFRDALPVQFSYALNGNTVLQ